jgi:hypothetical protein
MSGQILMTSSIMRQMMKKPAKMVAVLGVYLGFGLLWLGERQMPLSSLSFLLERYGWTSLGVLIITVSILYLMLSMSQAQREKRFIDIDDKISSSPDSSVIEKLIEEIEELKQTQPSVDYQRIEELIRKSSVAPPKPELDALRSFDNYFNAIRTTLEEKATVADQKASILLDKGTAYSRGGITFFILSIVVWQALSWIKGFEPQFIYGIASCSVLFIFIEFLSAWFLKQYRQFVDTSTYLIKVKSIFDRYMLAYLLLKEASGDNKEKLLEVLPLLKEDIKWPETYLLKNGDVSFAKETMETMTYLLKTIKETTKDAKEK